MTANRERGEAEIAGFMLRPSFNALVAAEEELGSLFELVERASAGKMKLSEMVALFWHCIADHKNADRHDFSEIVVSGGLAAATPALKILLSQILAGR